MSSIDTAPGGASRGPLHEILTAGLPDLRNKKTGLLSLNKLADTLKIARQSVYHNWLCIDRPNRVPAGQIQRLVELSAAQKNQSGDYEPLTVETLLPFVAIREQRAD